MVERLTRDHQLAVLRRASEIDLLLEEGCTLAEIRSAAVESGISPQAFDQALAEQARPSKGSAVGFGRMKQWVQGALLGGTGFVMGVLADVLHTPNPFVGEPAPLMLAAYGVLTALAFRVATTQKGSHFKFQISNLLLWAGFAIAWFDPTAPFTPSVLGWTLAFGMMSGGLGAARIAREDGTDLPSNERRAVSA